jgi:hypothetical protein
MDPDSQEAAKRAELKTRLEEIAGRKLDMPDEQLLSIIWPISSSTLLAKHDGDDDAWVTSERIIFPQPFCTDSNLLDTSGFSVTGSNGQAVFRLKNFLCGRDSIGSFNEPVNLLATPQGASPVFMTMNHELIKVSDPTQNFFTDVEITASAWNPNGTAAANVRFYWRCRVAVDFTLF